MFERDYHSTRRYAEDQTLSKQGRAASELIAPARRWLGRLFGTKASSEFEVLQPFEIRWLQERSLSSNDPRDPRPDPF